MLWLRVVMTAVVVALTVMVLTVTDFLELRVVWGGGGVTRPATSTPPIAHSRGVLGLPEASPPSTPTNDTTADPAHSQPTPPLDLSPLPGLAAISSSPPTITQAATTPRCRPRAAEATTTGLVYEVEAVAPATIHLTCQPLGSKYSLGDVNDQVAIFTGPRIMEILNDGIVPSVYLYDLLGLLRQLPSNYRLKPMAVRVGDSTKDTPFPIVAKVRKIGQDNIVLLPLNNARHFGPDFLRVANDGDPIAYEAKRPIAFWRGTTTGGYWDPKESPSHSRRHLVERWGRGVSPLVDVGLSFLAQDAKRHAKHYEPYVKPKQTVEEQLQYRYLIAVEGNDVATSLKWMLASNSTVLMPPPTMESWLRESCLIPWVHYVPLKPDTSDLEDKISYCEGHADQCQAIAAQATEYVQWYRDVEGLFRHGAQQLRAYLDSVRLEFPNDGAQASSSRPLVRCQQTTR